MRISRLRFLASDVVEVGNALIKEATPGGVALFLDRFARTSAFSAEERAEAGVEQILAHARAFIDAHKATIAVLADQSVVVTTLAKATKEVASGSKDPDEVDNWAELALRAAAILPYLSPEARETTEENLGMAIAEIAINPAAFVHGTWLATDRRDNESPAALGSFAEALITALERTGIEALIDSISQDPV